MRTGNPVSLALLTQEDRTIVASACKCVHERLYAPHRINCRWTLHLNVQCQVQNFKNTLEKLGFRKLANRFSLPRVKASEVHYMIVPAARALPPCSPCSENCNKGN